MSGFSSSPPSPYSASDHALLMLGRLDGRLAAGSVTDIWLARARMRGATLLARMAGVPIESSALQDWVTGRTLPPRHSEGLNDPLSVAALFHFALAASDDETDPLARATLNMSRRLLDDRDEAAVWGEGDLVRFGPAWRSVRQLIDAPYPAATLEAVADRLLEARQALARPASEGLLLTTADGRQLRVETMQADLGWLVACHLPLALYRAGLTMRLLPGLTDMPRLWPDRADALGQMVQAGLLKQAMAGLSDLDRLETRMRRLPERLMVTKRSKAPLLMRLELAYPGLSKVAVARLLGISHQGATKLVAQVRSLSDMG